eukprot:TRINITY_DN762_c0_g3_i1.p1 TRINITY_DN762_c0_g3~~TRINITY_DN762_c0_g3_i1.p1  ORF type:complete len:493 (-),score=132.33 TRINITY_DN762_c0_g3_i1:60-1412(-)
MEGRKEVGSIFGGPKKDEKHEFWQSQPVPQLQAKKKEEEKKDNVDVNKGREEEKKEGRDSVVPGPFKKLTADDRVLPVPDHIEWCSWTPDQCQGVDSPMIKEVHHLTTITDTGLGFLPSKELLEWSLKMPGYKFEWFIGFREKKTNILKGFISGIPCTIKVGDATLNLVEVKDLYISNDYRNQRLTPLLIGEITRRVVLTGCHQAIYTSAVLITKPTASSKYYTRALNVAKLVENGVEQIKDDTSINRLMDKLDFHNKNMFRVYSDKEVLRRLEQRDVSIVRPMLDQFLSRFHMKQEWSEKDWEYFFLPRDHVIGSWVLEVDGKIKGFCSYTILYASQVKAGVLYYYCMDNNNNKNNNDKNNNKQGEEKKKDNEEDEDEEESLKNLIANVIARAEQEHGIDLFMSLDIFGSKKILKSLGFQPTDSDIHYHLYNWRVGKDLTPHDVGINFV